MGPPRGSLRLIPPRGIKNFWGQKKQKTARTLKSKKLPLGEDIKYKRLKWDPIGDTRGYPATGDKKLEGSKKAKNRQ